MKPLEILAAFAERKGFRVFLALVRYRTLKGKEALVEDLSACKEGGVKLRARSYGDIARLKITLPHAWGPESVEELEEAIDAIHVEVDNRGEVTLVHISLERVDENLLNRLINRVVDGEP